MSARSRKSARGKPGIAISELQRYFAELLKPDQFTDYCPNGLQIEGTRRIARLVAGVTASERLIKAAEVAGADAVLVHHGYFWKGEDARLVGMKRNRIARLLNAGISLFAYHLPLDAHLEVGNNVQLANQLGWPVDGCAGPQGLVFYGDLPAALTPAQLGRRLQRRLAHKPLVVGPGDKSIRRIAWCTGGAQDYIDVAIDLRADAFISGEISERTTHHARECGIVYCAAGHHATERYGVQALGRAAADNFGIAFEFIDDPNPV